MHVSVFQGSGGVCISWLFASKSGFLRQNPTFFEAKNTSFSRPDELAAAHFRPAQIHPSPSISQPHRETGGRPPGFAAPRAQAQLAPPQVVADNYLPMPHTGEAMEFGGGSGGDRGT